MSRRGTMPGEAKGVETTVRFFSHHWGHVLRAYPSVAARKIRRPAATAGPRRRGRDGDDRHGRRRDRGLVRVFSQTLRGQQLEDRVMEGMYTNPRTDSVLLGGLNLVSVGAIVVALVLLAVFGVLWRRYDLALCAAVVVIGANITTQLLKYEILERADHGWSGPNTLPSGHVTVITSILMAVLIVLPGRWRPSMVPVAGFLATCGGVGTIIVQWHRPSDVIAAYAVVMAWTGLAVTAFAVTGRLRGRVPGRPRAFGYARGAGLAAGLVGLLILAAGVAPASGRKDLILTFVALTAVALACAGAVAVSSYAVDLLGDDSPSPGRPPPRR